MALTDKLKAIGDAIRGKTGKEGSLTLDEMVAEIEAIDTQAQTYILVDDDGNEVPAVLVEEEVTLTATPNDIRIGTTAVTGDGVVEGTKEIPSYHTSFGWKVVPNGSKFILAIEDYEYTKLQVIFCTFNETMINSVAAEKVAIDNKVYPVQSTEAEANAVVDNMNKCVDFGITNDSGKSYILRYSSYKEIY